MIDVYADGADYDGIINAARNNSIKGFTTNPTLMRAAGVTDYTKFARDIIPHLKDIRPDTNISLEVFADDTENIIEDNLVCRPSSFGYSLENGEYVFPKYEYPSCEGSNSYPVPEINLNLLENTISLKCKINETKKGDRSPPLYFLQESITLIQVQSSGLCQSDWRKKRRPVAIHPQ